MSEEVTSSDWAAPTLAGIKTGSLFTCACDFPQKLLEDIFAAVLTGCSAPKGLCLLPHALFRKDTFSFICSARQELSRDLQNGEAARAAAAGGLPLRSAAAVVVASAHRADCASGERVPRTRSGCFSAIRRRTSRALSTTAPADFKRAAACGRSTATRRRRAELFAQISKNARTSTANGSAGGLRASRELAVAV